ncbi:polysaccharide export protein [Glaciecola sp. MH2013]|uniref:polysaccharide biosynthesis/export family protein n=1 Tax=Glaciecola sp. MH2013 TaxID=2785524 RepID=UPI00189D61A8|nr:polysaccharide biosynthesis/export family protein [Glaciecola sp. MH2013]MBF7074885.1 polysaccharide export protein [Glaciecola sp. MH2013]
MLLALSSSQSLAQINNDLEQYRLGSGDFVKITVFGQDDLMVETRLSNVGVINYPFLGDINLVGLTLNEVESLIDKGLRGDYLVNPSVSVTVLEYRPFFIDGAVKKPGGYPYQPGLSISKAAALAGGFTERANRGNVIIVRKLAGKETEIEATEVDTILPGDIVTVNERFF